MKATARSKDINERMYRYVHLQGSCQHAQGHCYTQLRAISERENHSKCHDNRPVTSIAKGAKDETIRQTISKATPASYAAIHPRTNIAANQLFHSPKKLHRFISFSLFRWNWTGAQPSAPPYLQVGSAQSLTKHSATIAALHCDREMWKKYVDS